MGAARIVRLLLPLVQRRRASRFFPPPKISCGAKRQASSGEGMDTSIAIPQDIALENYDLRKKSLFKRLVSAFDWKLMFLLASLPLAAGLSVGFATSPRPGVAVGLATIVALLRFRFDRYRQKRSR